MKLSDSKLLLLFIFIFCGIWINSFVATNDYENWWIENILTFLSIVFLIFTYKYYRFSIGSYFFIILFLSLHVYGSKYTYADNVLGHWLKEILKLSRNPYDRIVHFSFGLLLYFPLNEFFNKWVKYPQTISNYFPVVLILALSGGFEIIEWLVADVFFKEHGEAYLGTQGDVWDAQKDMVLAFVGSLIAAFVTIKKLIRVV